jgi:hypothetical protein
MGGGKRTRGVAMLFIRNMAAQTDVGGRCGDLNVSRLFYLVYVEAWRHVSANFALRIGFA